MRPALLLLVLLATGCTYTRPLSTAVDASRSAPARFAQRGPALLTLDGGPSVRAVRVTVGPDSTRWTDPETGAAHVAATSRVTSLCFRHVGRSESVGWLTGTAIGVGLGAFLGAALHKERNPNGFQREGAAVVGAVIVGAISGPGGVASLGNSLRLECFRSGADADGSP